jgi:hypothetical protein
MRTITMSVPDDLTPERVRQLGEMTAKHVGPQAAGLLANLANVMATEPGEDPHVLRVTVGYVWGEIGPPTLSDIASKAEADGRFVTADVLRSVIAAMEEQRPEPIEPGVYVVHWVKGLDAFKKYTRWTGSQWVNAVGDPQPHVPTQRSAIKELVRLEESYDD